MANNGASNSNNSSSSVSEMLSPKGEEQCLKTLFHKRLSASDVSKLNRLIVPKKNAMAHFCDSESNNSVQIVEVDKDLVFYDRLNVQWKFRYCYWKGSRSLVFTKGWNAFVMAKRLKENDIVKFLRCEYCKQSHHHLHHPNHSGFVIDVEYYNGGLHDDPPVIKTETEVEAEPDNINVFQLDQLIQGRKDDLASPQEEEEDDDVVFLYERKPTERDLVQSRVSPLPPQVEEKSGVVEKSGASGCSTSKGIMLFGVQIGD